LKNKILFTLLIYLVSTLFTSGQAFTDSNLPIVIINTDNSAPILDDPRVLGTMKIIYRGPGERNYVSDQNNPQYLNYNGRIEIEIRGSSSQERPKKQYGFTTLMPDNLTNNNVKLLGMPAENDWILNAMVFDPALMRDYLCYNLSRQIGEYASRTAYCELIINGGYKGLYLLQEKVKVDNNRVNVTKITRTDNSLPSITGGYIIKSDKTTGGDPVAWTMKDWNGNEVAFIHDFPNPEDITAYQSLYIHNRFTFLEIAALTGNTSSPDGFQYVIDIPSFIDYMIISELSSNADAYMFSTYYHKDRNGRLRAGPIWDNDLTFGNDLFFWGLDRSKTNVWQFANGDNEGARFWRDLFSNDDFRCALGKRWTLLTQPGQPLNQSVLEAFIDQTAAYISEAVVRNNLLWGNTGVHQQRLQEIKTFISNRIPWISNNLLVSSSCGSVSLPPLVISKIMYHPAVSALYPDNDDMEYLEITNNGNEPVDPEGIFFAGTGFVFDFPSGTLIEPYSSIILAGNYKVFRSMYGFTPYGEFTRNLSDKSEDLLMCDAFGNIIDNVCYQDTVPWPYADGNGNYLKLISPELDNSEPLSWIASSDIPTYYGNTTEDQILRIYPNPASDILNIEAGNMIERIIINDIYGRRQLFAEPQSQSCILDITGLPAGLYIISVETTSGSSSRKFIRLKP
jgi:CotH kinase protein/Secretion system C-terminal sorting domain